MYTILHCHDTWGSLGDSTLHISDYLQKIHTMGMKAAAITNHGSLASIYSFYSACTSYGIKPIIGYEAYFTDDVSIRNPNASRFHLVLLARTQEGFHNLIQLHNEASLQHFYYKPRIDIGLLKRYGKGLIGLSACIAGQIPSLILQHASDNMLYQVIQQYQSCLDAFYLELQPGDFPEQHIVNQKLIQLSEIYNIPLVATNDVHYLNKEDASVHDTHIKLYRRQCDITGLIYPDTCYYVMPENEFSASFKNIPKHIIESAIQNTNHIADTIEHIKPYCMQYMPILPGMTEKDCYLKLEQETCTALENLFISWTDEKKQIYYQRLKEELKIIRALQFSGYFLVVADYIRYCKTHNILTGPGRGSVCGSLTAYLLKITNVDPIEHHLLFERFLSKDRTDSIPDIDIDIPPESRPQIVQYLIETYGEDRVAEISTIGMRKYKKAIRDAGRILQLTQEQINYMAKKMPDHYEGPQCNNDNEFDELNEFFYKMNPKWYKLTLQLAGYPSQRGIHPAGVIISPVSLKNQIPLYKNSNGMITTEFTLEDVEEAGFVKMDLLQLKTLSLCNHIYQLEPNISNQRKNLQDKRVWNIIGSSDTFGLFQISGALYRSRMRSLHPNSIEELANILALLRGPCISAGLDTVYEQRLNGKPYNLYELGAEYAEITKNTYGILLYQEQIMLLCHRIGFSMQDAFRLMKAVSKKKIDIIRQFEKLFKQYADKKNIQPIIRNQLWDLILNAGRYCFNKSHAIAYALLCYDTAYLRVYYPLAFYAALLTHESSKDKGDIKLILKQLQKHRIKLLPLDINKSRWKYVIENNQIREGFCGIKTIGEKAYQAIKKASDKTPILSLEDFYMRVEQRSCNKTVRKALIKHNCFHGDIDTLLEKLSQLNKKDITIRCQTLIEVLINYCKRKERKVL